MKKFYGLLAAALVILAACTTSGPQKALDEMAAALEKKDGAAFLAKMDLKAYTDNQVKTFVGKSDILSGLNELGQQFGLSEIFGGGNLDSLVGNVLDVEGKIREEFRTGVDTGSLPAQCAKATNPDCPWTPAALRSAAVTELGPDAAIASVTTAANIKSWLVLRRTGQNWLVTGRAPLESEARQMARPEQKPATPAQPGQQPSEGKAVSI